MLALVDLARPLAPGRPAWLQSGMALGVACGILVAALLSSLRGRAAADPMALYVFLLLAVDLSGQMLAPHGWPVWPLVALLVASVSVAEPAGIALSIAALAGGLEVAQSAAGRFAVWKPAAIAAVGYVLLVGAVHRALASEKDRLGATLAELARLRHGIGHLDESEGSLVGSGQTLTLRHVSEEERQARQTERVEELDASLGRLVTLARLAVSAHAVFVFAIDREKEVAYLRAADGPELIRRDAAVPLDGDPVAFVVERAQTFYATDFKRLLWALPYYGAETKVGTLIAVPIVVAGSVMAVLVADQLEVQAFTKTEPALLEGFADMAAEAFAHARATASREELGSEFEAVYGVSRQLAAMGDVAPVCRALLDSSRQLVPLRGGAVVLSDDAQTRYALQEVFGWAKELEGREVGLTERTWAAWALRSAEDNYLLDDLGSEKERMPVLVLDEPGRRDESLLVLPLRAANRALGALVLTADRGVFNATTKRVLGILANQAAALLARIQLTEKIREKAMRDPLTGLHNRRAFADDLSQALAREERHDGCLALVMLDLDHFKKLNDTYGHPAGDAALRTTAQVLRQLLRRGDVAARYGGEEFVVMLPGAHEVGALKFAERIRGAIERATIEYAGETLHVTASLGLAVWPGDTRDPDALLTVADRALYAAKATGRNRVVRAEPVASSPVADGTALEGRT